MSKTLHDSLNPFQSVTQDSHPLWRVTCTVSWALASGTPAYRKEKCQNIISVSHIPMPASSSWLLIKIIFKVRLKKNMPRSGFNVCHHGFAVTDSLLNIYIFCHQILQQLVSFSAASPNLTHSVYLASVFMTLLFHNRMCPQNLTHLQFSSTAMDGKEICTPEPWSNLVKTILSLRRSEKTFWKLISYLLKDTALKSRTA